MTSFRAAAIAIASLAAASGCLHRGRGKSGPEPETSSSASRQDVVSDVAFDLILPTYRDLARSAGELESAIASLRAAPDDLTLSSAQAAWRAARSPWNRAKAFYFGPIADDFIGPKLELFPPNLDRMEDLIQGTEVLDEDLVRNLGASSKGFLALQYLLFDGTDGNAAVLARLVTAPGAERRLAFAYWTAVALRKDSEALLAAWSSPGGGYANALTRSGTSGSPYKTAQDSLNAIVNSIVFLAESVADQSLGRPLGRFAGGIPQPSQVATAASGDAVEECVDNLLGIRDVYLGVEGERLGLSALIRPLSREVDNGARKDLEDALAAVRAIPPPLELAVIAHPAAVELAHEKVKALRLTLAVDVVSVLETTLSFSPFDGD